MIKTRIWEETKVKDGNQPAPLFQLLRNTAAVQLSKEMEKWLCVPKISE